MSRDLRPRIQTKGLTYYEKRVQQHFMENYLEEPPRVFVANKERKRKGYWTDVGDFPRNVREFYWIYYNYKDDRIYGLCRLHCGLYAYFRIVIFGFYMFIEEPQSKLVVSSSWEELIQYGMSKKAYKKYMKKTIPYT